MAITKIKPIRGTISKALAYIENPDKTDEKLLVSSFGCSIETAAKEFEWTRRIAEQQGMNPTKIIARHMIQSFAVGEVSPELAHEIGQQFADEVLQGKYEYVLATHIDKGHVHNHIIFNAVNFVDYHAYKSYKKIYYETQEISDRLCKENGLSVIPPSQSKGKSYKEYTEAKNGTSWKQKLKMTIDRIVITASGYEDFLTLMEEAGYEIKPGKYISFRAAGQERFTRAKTIGDNYTEERIKERIKGRSARRIASRRDSKGISLIIDIQNCLRAQESKGYEHWAKINNLKQASATLNYLTENNLLKYADLEAKMTDLTNSYQKTGSDLKKLEKRLKQVQLLIKHISQYQRTKPVYDQYRKAKKRDEYFKQHSADITIYEASRDTLKAMQTGNKLPSLSSLVLEQERLVQEQQRLYDERHKLDKDRKKIETMKRNVDSILGVGQERKEADQEVVKDNNRE